MDDEPTPPRERPRDHVTSTLAKRILSGALAPGARLPTEAELTEELAVSRTALRESMRTLAGKGLISTRTRTGSVVQPAARWNNLDPELLAWREELAPDVDFLKALTEARAVIEPAAAALAAERATAADIAEIESALAAMRSAAGEDDLESSVAADEAFHLAIVRASRNIVFVNFGALIGSALRQSFRLTTPAAISKDRALDVHGRVLHAIAAGEPGAALDAMTRLVGVASEDLARALAMPQRKSEDGGGSASDGLKVPGPAGGSHDVDGG